jgi:tripartite-type tricarboxylate transporter receptor subunit TctC
MSSSRIKSLSACMTLIPALAMPATSHAQDAAEFYPGKTLNLLIGYPPGGAYDVYARLIGRYMSKHLPGQPQIVVKNVPGAASLVLVNQLFTTVPKDGLSFATFARSVAMDRLLGREGTNFDPVQFNWIGSANNEVSICAVWESAGVQSMDDFLSKPIIFGANAPGSESDVYPTILNRLLGTKFKIVTGYPGTPDLIIAMERGETQGRCGFTWSAAKTSYSELIRDKKLQPVVQFATTKHPELPNVPLATDMAKSPQSRAALELLLTQQAMGRPFAAPPGVPADRVAALRSAFDATMRDGEFLAEAAKQNLEIQPIPGAAIQDMVAGMFKAPPEVVAAAREAISK